MKAFYSIFIVALFCLAAAPSAQAQDDFVMGEVTPAPICFNVVNMAPYTVYGSVMTNLYVAEGGTKAHHRSNFRLAEKEQAEFCTSGPFYDGRMVDFTLRTLVPIFSCRTAITGDIVIKGGRKPDGGTDTWAECLE